MKSQRNKSSNNMVSNLDTILSKNTITCQYKPLASAVLAGMVATILPLSVSHTASASELDVYEIGGAVQQSSNGNGPVITLMLDTNGRMGRGSIGQAFSGVGDLQYKRGETEYPDAGCTPDLPREGRPTNYGYVETRSVIINGETIEYKMYGCKATANADGVETGDQLYDQISRLKDAVITLLANTDSEDESRPFIPDEVSIGLGRYSAEIDPSLPFSTNSSGNMLVPAKPLTIQQRADLIRAMSGIRPIGEGPVPQALAEAGAYMLGTTTADRLTQKTIGYEVGGRVSRVANPNNDWETQFFKCKIVLPVEATNHSDFTNAGLTHVARCITNYPESWGVNNYLNLRDRVDSPTNLPYTTGYGPLKVGHRYYSYFFTKTGILPDSAYSGFGLSKANTKKPSGQTYESPLNISGIVNHSNNQCGAKGASGIYFLTSGYPTSPVKNQPAGTDFVAATNNAASKGMNKSLDIIPGNNQVNCSTPGLINSYKKQIIFDGRPSNVEEYPAWGCTGSYAKILREKAGIVTAIAGMGPLFEGIPKSGDKYNCDAVPIPDREGALGAPQITKSENSLQNKVSACKVAARGQGFGEGGFYPVKTSREIADSIQDFIEKLGGAEYYKPQQGDGLTVAADITDATTSSSFAFLPLMLPRPGSNQLSWAGNVNKYKVMNGSLFDKNNEHIYDNVSGQIKLNTTELWNNSGDPDGGAVRTMEVDKVTYKPAGAYAQLLAPELTRTNSTRVVYVETANGSMKKIGVTGNKPFNVDNLGYDFQKQQYLLNFLGYNVPVFANSQRITANDYDPTTGILKNQTNPMNDISSYVPTDPVKILGGVNNSKPQEVVYQSIETHDPSTDTTSKENISAVLYGSLDGALHLIDGETGQEYFAFIPKPVVTSDRNIAVFKEGSNKLADGTNNQTGKIAYGIDAPWYVDMLLNRKYEGNKITYSTDAIEGASEGHIHAYGGLGRGGMGFYGLNITNKIDPKLLFNISNTKTGFERLGNTWSKPTKAKIKYESSTQTVNKDVLFVTGGYDFCYDNPDFNLNANNIDWKTTVDQTGESCSNKDKALGNTVYMIDASNGDLLWTAKLDGTTPSSTKVTDRDASKSAGNPYLKHSIPGEAAVIDTNFDGYVDSIYFADLGGQVFRADFSGNYIQNTGIKSKVSRILDTSNTNSDYVPLRFFERPVVSAYRFDITKQGGSITKVVTDSKGTNQVQVVSVASGDRNNPLSVLNTRKIAEQPNKLISVWNADKIDDTNIVKLSGSDLFKLDFSGDMSLANKVNLISGAVKGWYNDLTYFKGVTVQDTDTEQKIKSRTGTQSDAIGDSVNYLRAFGQPVIKGGRLFVSIYNNQAYIPAPEGTCYPVPTGVTEAQEYCMPFGTCSNGRGDIHTLGPGVASANFAAIGEGSNEFALVTPAEIKKTSNGSNGSTAGGSGKLEEKRGIFASLYDLLPHRWFELLPNNK